MSLNHIDEASKFKANNRNDQTYFPLIEKKPPRSYMIKSSSTIINQNERKQTNDLAKNIKNPEVNFF